MTNRLKLFFYLFFISNIALAAFQKNIWPKWEINNPLSTAVISHHEWHDFLKHCVKTNEEGINLVDYPHLTEIELQSLKSYITRMSNIDISQYNRREQLAFWINLYNAVTVQIVADYYPVESVQDINISPGLFSVGPWEADHIKVADTKLSLDDIQNRIIRPIWNDPRTLYAVNDASIGAANLNKSPFEGALIEQQLNESASNYINSLRGLQLIEGQLIVSKIFDWYLDDFGGSERDVLYHISLFANPHLKAHLEKIQAIHGFIYNWHLNSTVARSS